MLTPRSVRTSVAGVTSLPRILLVEDNELNRDMLRRRLEKHGFEVDVAGDGAAALAAVRDRRPDLVLMDLSLPGLDGWEATRLLKDDITLRAIPIIAITAHAMPGEKERALAAGCNDYDAKPVDLPRLLAKIHRQLDSDG